MQVNFMKALVTMGDPSLTIVTIHKGEIAPLLQTLESLKTIEYFEQVFVLSDTITTDSELLSSVEHNCQKVVIIRDQDRSLYHAMNLGLDATSGQYVWFVNSGDTPIGDPSTYIERNKKYSYWFSTIQTWNGAYYLRVSDRSETTNRRFSHQGFVANMDVVQKNRIRFDISRAISADVHWMKEIENISKVVAVPKPIAMYALGGLSSNPTLKSVAIRFRHETLSSCVKEMVKLFLRKTLGAARYYSFIAAMNGYKRLDGK